jgi:hypothetical protein
MEADETVELIHSKVELEALVAGLSLAIQHTDMTDSSCDWFQWSRWHRMKLYFEDILATNLDDMEL